MFKRIVVPLDGSPLAEKALDEAVDLAGQHGTPLFLVRAVDPPRAIVVSSLSTTPASGVATAEDTGIEERAAHEYINGKLTDLTARGHTASGAVVIGPAAAAVASTLLDTDLLVLSSHGRTGIKRWFMGSVAEDILKRTSVSVYLVRHSASEG
jgi:nucleotide-binding universal stress UspA family protein